MYKFIKINNFILNVNKIVHVCYFFSGKKSEGGVIKIRTNKLLQTITINYSSRDELIEAFEFLIDSLVFHKETNKTD